MTNHSSGQPDSTDEATVRRTLVNELRQRPVLGGIVGMLLAVHGVLVFSTASYCTVTHDEYWHIPVGLYNLRYQQFDFDDLNPPLGRMVAAAPLFFLAEHPERIPTVRNDLWAYGDEFLELEGDRFHFLVVAARCMGVLLSVFFALVAASWATEEFGFRSGLATILMWSLSPSLIANAGLATNDLFVSGLFLAAVWRVRRLAISGTTKDGVLVGLLIGLACLVKFTGLLLFGVAPLCLVVSRPSAVGRPNWSDLAIRLAVGYCVAVLVINAGYLFHGSGVAIGDYSFASKACRSIQSGFSSLAAMPVPLPESFLRGVDHQRAMMEGNHPVYLSGEWSETGFWTYFVWVFAWKLPHGLQILTAITTWAWFHQRKSKLISAEQRHSQNAVLKTLLIPSGVLFAIGSLSGMQLGLRYVLPAVPLLMIYGSWFLAEWFPARGRITNAVCWIALLSSIFSVRHHPHHLAYFNELSGGPSNGWKLLSDSNIDWGQDLRKLKEYLDVHPEVADLRLAYFGTFPPGQLGLKYRLPSPTPEPGWYAVSVNLLQGRPNPLRNSDDSTENVYRDRCSYLRFFEPKARIGESIRVYQLTPEQIKQWRIEARQAHSRL